SKIALSIKVGNAIGSFAINQFDFRTSPLANTTSTAAPAVVPAEDHTARAMDLASLASSLLDSASQPVVSSLTPGPAAPSEQPSSQSPTPPTPGTASLGQVEATDAFFAISHAAKHDDSAWLVLPLFLSSLDAM